MAKEEQVAAEDHEHLDEWQERVTFTILGSRRGVYGARKFVVSVSALGTMAAGQPALDGGNAMTTTTRFLRRDPAEVRPWAETCGQIRCLIEEKDGAAGEVHHVEIQNAKLPRILPTVPGRRNGAMPGC